MGRRTVFRDPSHLIAERAMRDERYLIVVQNLARAADPVRGGWKAMADNGSFFRDSRYPWVLADATAVAGTTEAIAYPVSWTAIPANYLWAGKMNKVTLHGKLITAGASPGTMTWTGRYGTAGTSADISLGATAASPTMTISLTKTMHVEMWTTCRAAGSGTAGSIVASGRVGYDSAIVAGTAGNLTYQVLPSGAISAAGVDTTAVKGINLNVTLGSASDNFTAQLLQFEALN